MLEGAAAAVDVGVPEQTGIVHDPLYVAVNAIPAPFTETSDVN